MSCRHFVSACFLSWNKIDWLINWFIDQVIDWSIDLLIVWSIDIDFMIVWLISWLIDGSIDGLIDRSNDWMTDLLTVWLTDWLTLKAVVMNCTVDTWTCPAGFSQCHGSHQCIPVSWFCDGFDHRGDGSDDNDSFCSESFILQLFKTAPFLNTLYKHLI